MDSCNQVADFGMSMNIRGNKTHVSGVRHGTPMYISPEIVRNGKASKAADVYSFGVMMWELCHGMLAWQQVRPWSACSLSMTLQSISKMLILNLSFHFFAVSSGDEGSKESQQEGGSRRSLSPRSLPSQSLHLL